MEYDVTFMQCEGILLHVVGNEIDAPQFTTRRRDNAGRGQGARRIVPKDDLLLVPID